MKLRNTKLGGHSSSQHLKGVNPQDHRALKLNLITLHVTRLGMKKVYKVGPDWGLKGHELGRCSGWPKVVYKVTLKGDELMLWKLWWPSQGNKQLESHSGNANPIHLKFWCFQHVYAIEMGGSFSQLTSDDVCKWLWNNTPPPIYKKSIGKYTCAHTNIRLENELLALRFFWYNAITIASTTYKKYVS